MQISCLGLWIRVANSQDSVDRPTRGYHLAMTRHTAFVVGLYILQFPILFIICLPVILVRAANKQGAYWSNVKEDAKLLFGWWFDHMAWLGP